MDREIRGEYDGMLFFALDEDADARLERLLTAGANPNALNEDGVPALHRAIARRRTKAIFALLAAGADPLSKADGMGCAWDAAKGAGVEIAGILRPRVDELTAAKVRGEPWFETMPDRKDARGYSLLHLAAQDGLDKTIGQLLAAGAMPDDQTLVEGDTALHLAARGGHVRCCRILAEAGADARLENDDGITPLSMAAKDEGLRAAMLATAR